MRGRDVAFTACEIVIPQIGSELPSCLVPMPLIGAHQRAAEKPRMGLSAQPLWGMVIVAGTAKLLPVASAISHLAIRRERKLKSAYVVSENGHIELVVGEMPTPHPVNDELLIRVKAAGVTPTELSWYPTVHTKEGTSRVNAIPGHEFSGVIVGIGGKVQGYAVGDEVYGMNDWFVQGSAAEFCLAFPSGVTQKPSKLTHIEAAAVPIAALTAWQGLFDRGKLQAGDRLLVHGGSGSVGTFVIQLAKMHGAEVFATCSRKNVEFLRSLNVDQVIDYEAVRFEDIVSNVDMVFDAVGGDSLERSWPLLKATGRAVTIASDSESSSDPRIKASFFIVQPNHQQLTDLGPLLEAGYLRPFVGATPSLSEAPEAYRGTIKSNSGHGKTVLVIEKQG
jgi:NADPH:quinone reductase-like Zn-dependent oxidoreductase